MKKVLWYKRECFFLFYETKLERRVVVNIITILFLNLKVFEVNYGTAPGDTVMMLNGLIIDTDVAEPFL